MKIMAKATTKSASTPSPLKTKSTKRGKKACILSVVQAQADIPVLRISLKTRWVIRVINIPEQSDTEMKLEELELIPKYSDTEMKLEDLEVKLNKLKLQLKNLGKMDAEVEAVMEKTDVEDEIVTRPELKKVEIDPLHPDSSRLRALVDVAYSQLLMLVDDASSNIDVNAYEL